MTARGPLARGDVVLVRFPFTDLSGVKLRPALIVGRAVRDDALLAFITSRVQPQFPPSSCALLPADPEFRRTGLKVASRVRLDRLVTLHVSLVHRRLGQIGPRMTACVDAALRDALGLA